MIDTEKLKFDDKGLIPAIVVDYYTKDVLTLAYMNKESLEITLKEGTTCFFSRSRQCLWRKGETSGNVQKVMKITADCDCDALTVEVIKAGPACHTGSESCFFNDVYENENSPERFSLESLAQLIAGRKKQADENLASGQKTERGKGSYTTYLFENGVDKILKKVGEESTEVIIAAKAEDRKETVYEIADLTYHVLVLMENAGISVKEIKDELASRHVIDKKVKQEKMT